MNSRVSKDCTRRQALAAVGIGLVLAGCSGPRRRRPPLSDDPIWTGRDRDPWPSEDARSDADPIRIEVSRDVTPNVLPRSRWTRESPNLSLSNPMGSISRITIHHDGMPPVTLRSERDVAARIEAIRQSHVRRGWADIGYHYVVDPQGRIWQARPRSLQGAHVKYNNEHNLGVLVLGNFMEQYPTQQALAALDAFVVANMHRFRVPMNSLYTHQELAATACPGTHLQSHMVQAREWRGSIAARV